MKAWIRFLGQDDKFLDKYPNDLATHLVVNPDKIELILGSRLILGRANSADVILPSTRLARHHAMVSLTSISRMAVVCLGGTNGTYVDNGIVLSPKSGDRNQPISVAILSPGQEFSLAHEITFRFETNQ